MRGLLSRSRQRPTSGAPEDRVSTAELARAARILSVRARREATGLFAGSYASAFRGGGMEFHESRPYVPGDDVRAIDWNALARSGEPFVKRFREERDLALLMALDVSESMRFGTTGRSKAALGAHAASLLAAAAGQAGDRVGLVCFDESLREAIPPARGSAHTWRVIQRASLCAGDSGGGTRLAAGIEGLLAHSPRRAVTVLLSDFRDPVLLDAAVRRSGPLAGLLSLSQHNDTVCAVLHDPREEALPPVGLVRVADPERPGRRRVLNASSARVRSRYRRAWAARARALERALQGAGSEVLWLRTDRDPLRSWAHFFRERAARARRAS